MGEGADASEDGRGRKAFAFAWQQGDDSPHTGTGRGRSWVARAGDYTGALSMTRHDAVAFSCKDSGQDAGEAAPTLRAMGHDRSHANGGGQLAVAFNHIQDPVSSASVAPTLGEEGQAVAVTSGPKMWDDRGIHRGTVSRPVTPTLNGYEQPMVLPAVRRLTPTECERLQAFPDGHTCLCGVEPYSTAGCRCPDGPRYAALGNAVTTSVIEWLGRRLLAHHNGT